MGRPQSWPPSLLQGGLLGEVWWPDARRELHTHLCTRVLHTYDDQNALQNPTQDAPAAARRPQSPPPRPAAGQPARRGRAARRAARAWRTTSRPAQRAPAAAPRRARPASPSAASAASAGHAPALSIDGHKRVAGKHEIRYAQKTSRLYGVLLRGHPHSQHQRLQRYPVYNCAQQGRPKQSRL